MIFSNRIRNGTLSLLHKGKGEKWFNSKEAGLVGTSLSAYLTNKASRGEREVGEKD